MIKKYIELIDRFLKNEISTKEFERAYLDEFDIDADNVEEELYDIIEPLSLDVHDYTDIQELLNSGSDHYINEEQLRKSATQALLELRDLSALWVIQIWSGENEMRYIYRDNLIDSLDAIADYDFQKLHGLKMIKGSVTRFMKLLKGSFVRDSMMPLSQVTSFLAKRLMKNFMSWSRYATPLDIIGMAEKKSF